MDMKRKLEILAQSVASIATHTDDDSVILLAALDKADAIIGDARAAIATRVAAETAAAIGG